MMIRRSFLTAFVLSISVLTPGTGEATIIVTDILTDAQILYVVGGNNDQLDDQHTSAGSQVAKTYPVFTPPLGAPLDTSGKPAVLAATQPAFGFNSVLARGFFANGLTDSMDAKTVYVEQATGQLGDAVAVNFDLFGGQLGITCYGGQPTSVADIARVCHPSAGTAVEVSANISLERGPHRLDFHAGLKMEVVADSSAPTGVRVDITQSQLPGSTPLVYHLGISTADGFPPYVTLDFDALQGSLDVGPVNTASQPLFLTYDLEAKVTVDGRETGGFARIADPFALQSDPIGYFQSQFPGAPLPGFVAVDNGPPPGGSAPEPGTLALCLAGITGYVASRRRDPCRVDRELLRSRIARRTRSWTRLEEDLRALPR